MPASTFNQLVPLLQTYVEPDGDFKSSLNQVLARIHNMGTYRDLTVQFSLPVSDGCITLPDEADAILHTMINGQPAPVRSLWHDFRSIGTGTLTSADETWGLIDAGFHPVLRNISEATDELFVVPSAQSVDGRVIDPDDGEEITMVASDGDQRYTAGVNPSNQKIEWSAPVSFVNSIRFDGLLSRYDIRTDENDPETTIATVGPDCGVTRYRRFRVSNAGDPNTTVHVLCKRAFKPIFGDNDIVYIANTGALKHGLLGRLAEDNGDVERAEYHWSKCFTLLEEEAASTRGAAIPRLNVDPYGTSHRNGIHSIY